MANSALRVRTTKLDEFQFLTCLRHGLWGSRSARFKDWRVGDKLILLVGNAVAGLAEVTGAAFVSNDPVWDNDLFPHRIPISFVYAGREENRLPVLGEVREALAQSFDGGGGWGLGILNQRLMKTDQAAFLIRSIVARGSELKEVQSSIDELLADAKAKRDSKAGRTRRTVRNSEIQAPLPAANAPKTAATRQSDSDETPSQSESLHHLAQLRLVQLAQVVGCSAWVASNDKSKSIAGRALGDGCLTSLPNMGLNPQATRAIGLIDVLWVRKNAPVAAFEVEATTSVYSGLLRLSDLVEVVPAIRLDLYIVAPREREAKVLRELARPTFRRVGLTDTCKFVAVEDLEALLERTTGMKGHIQPSIVESIATAAPDTELSAMS
jgi:hypothetical protein